MIWSTSSATQGEFRSDDPEDLLAALDLEAELAVGLDLPPFAWASRSRSVEAPL